MSEPSPPQIIGRYAIYGKIASGGMASVHFGRLLGGAGFSRTVAVKRLHPHLAEDPEFLSTMIDEARLAARIQHPNVVPTLDVVSLDGELLLVMEYVRGESVARLVRIEAGRQRLVPLPIAGAIMHGALHGLHAAHEATSDHGEPLGMVHRDVSPQNILVGVDGMTRVIDFGVAKAAGRLQTTREGVIKGKIAYMAPEQLAGRDVSRAADVYAMGVVLWEMLTGRRLFQADSDAALVGKVFAGAQEPPSAYVQGLPAHVDAVVMRALAPNPQQRFATAREMADMLTRVLPPALPDDVGAWCSEAAHDTLAKRGALVSEIESHSGTGPQMPRVSMPDLGSARHSSHSKLSNDEPAAMGSQASNLSMATPAQPAPRWRATAGIVVGGIILVGFGFAAATWTARQTASATSPASTTVFADPPTPAAASTGAPTAPPTASSPPAAPPAAPPTAPSASATTEPNGAPASTANAAPASTPRAAPKGTSPAAKPKSAAQAGDLGF